MEEKTYTKFGDMPNLYVDDQNRPVYIVPPDAIPNGGYVLVNGSICWHRSERQMREDNARYKAEYEAELRHVKRPFWKRLFKLQEHPA